MSSRNRRANRDRFQERRSESAQTPVGSVDELNQLIVNDLHVIPLVHTKSGYHRPATQATAIEDIHKPRRIAFNPFNPNILTQGGTVTQILKTESLGPCQFLGVELIVRNSSGANTVTLLPTSQWASPVRIYRDGGSKEIQRLHDTPSWLYNRYYSSEQMNAQQSVLTNTDPLTYIADTAMAVNEIRPYLLTLPNNFIQFAGLALDKIRGDVQFKLEFRAGGVVATRTGTPVVDAMNFLYYDIPLTNDTSDAYDRIYKAFQCNFIQWVPVEFGGQTFTASQKSTFKLDNCRGQCVAIGFGVRASKAAANLACLTYTSLGTAGVPGTFNIRRGATSNLYDQPLQTHTLRYLENPSDFPASQFFSAIPYVFLNFSDGSVFQSEQ